MRNLAIGCAVMVFVALSATSEARAPAQHQVKSMEKMLAWVSLNQTQVGVASWYGAESAGKTASGEVYDMNGLTAAHRTLPFNSRIKVTNLKNGRAVILRVTDRGPNVTGRLLDVSMRAAEILGFTKSGRTRVRVTVLGYPRGYVAEPATFLPLAYCAEIQIISFRHTADVPVRPAGEPL